MRALALSLPGVVLVGVAASGCAQEKDPGDYSDCSFFVGRPGTVDDAECVENGKVVRWTDSDAYRESELPAPYNG